MKALENLSMDKTKTVAIVNCIGDYIFEELKQEMQENLCSIILDGNNERRPQKNVPLSRFAFMMYALISL